MSRSLPLLAALSSLALAPSAPAQPLPRGEPITNFGVVVEGNQVPEAEAGRGLRAKVLLTQRTTDEKDVGLAVVTAAKGSEIPLHRHRASEVFYVLEGKGEVTGPGANPTPIAAGDFVYTPPGVAHGVKATEPMRLAVAFFPGGPELRYSGGKDPGTTPVGKGEAAEKKHSIVIDGAKLQPHSAFDGNATSRVALDASVANVSAALVEIQPGTAISKDPHPHSLEVEYLIEGGETVTLGQTEVEATAPAAVRIPPDVKHSFKVAAGRTLKVLLFYSPPEPEQTDLAPKKK